VRHGGVDERGREPTVAVVLALLRVELDAEREAPRGTSTASLTSSSDTATARRPRPIRLTARWWLLDAPLRAPTTRRASDPLPAVIGCRSRWSAATQSPLVLVKRAAEENVQELVATAHPDDRNVLFQRDLHRREVL